jgi:hypothetical protein
MAAAGRGCRYDRIKPGPIVIPVVDAIGLAVWIFLVYYADSHPYWRGQATASKQLRAGASPAADQRLDVAQRRAAPTRHADDPITRRPRRMDEQETPRAA